MARPADPLSRLRDTDAARAAQKRKAARRRSARRALRVNLAIFFALLGLGLLAWRAERLAPLLERHGDVLGRAADTLRRADLDAVGSEEIFTLRRRIETRFRDCAGLSAASRPIRLRSLPGMLSVEAEGARRPAMELNLSELKQTGPTGGWITSRPAHGLTEGQMRGLSALAAFAVYDPTGPCPNDGGWVTRR